MTSAEPTPTWHPKAIVFDLLTALLDSWTLWDLSTPTHTPGSARPWRQRYLELTFSQGRYVPYEDLVRQSAADVGLPPSAPEGLVYAWRTLQAWPEVEEVLTGLKGKGYRLGVVTNCSVGLGRLAARCADPLSPAFGVGAASSSVLASAGSGGGGGGSGSGQGESIFDAMITAEESGFYKPAREAYQAIMDKMGLEAEDILFVAGSAGDVQGATEAGMRVVWHNKIGLARKGDAVPLREAGDLRECLEGFL